MNIPPKHIFRSYDIRGTAEPTEKKPNPDLTEENIYHIGQGIGTYLQTKYAAKHLAIARDNRTHSEKLSQSFIQGVLSTGLETTNLGYATSPMLYWSTCSSLRPNPLPYDCGVMITASHNPSSDNGLKIVSKNAHSIADQELQEIYQIIETQAFISKTNPGQLNQNNNLFTLYLNDLKSKISIKRKLKIVIDSGNGITGIFAPHIFKELGCEVHELYTNLDGTFPNHEANPEHAKNLLEASNLLSKNNFDFGIGFDGDGDRVGFLDEKGMHYSAEYPLTLLSENLQKTSPGEKVIFDVKVCNFLAKKITKQGGIPIMSRTGHSYIENRLKTENASLAGEKSGHFFFGPKLNYYGFDDAIYAACLIAEHISASDLSFSEYFLNIPKNPQIPELKIPCPDHLKFDIIETLKQEFQNLYPCILIDGIRIEFTPNTWGLIRASNTSPYLTSHFEAPTEEKLEEIKKFLISKTETLLKQKLT